MIAFTLDRQYHRLWKNAPSDSKELFGDDFTKRMTITNNEKIFQTASRNYNSSWDKNSKNLRRSSQNPRNPSQYGYSGCVIQRGVLIIGGGGVEKFKIINKRGGLIK